MKNRTVLTQSDEYFFAKNLKMLRMTHKPYLSQSAMAQKLGVCRTTYNSYERGVRQAPAFFVANAAEYFSVTIDSMMYQKLWKE